MSSSAGTGICISGTVVVLVDGSNVAHAFGVPPRLQTLLQTLEALDRADLPRVTLVDASLRHRIDDRNSLEGMVRSGQVLQVPAGRSADEFLLQLASRYTEKGVCVYVLTNDTFSERDPGSAHRRIAFLAAVVAGSQELLFSPTLESIKSSGNLSPAGPRPTQTD